MQGEPVIPEEMQIKRQFVYSTLKTVIADCEGVTSVERNETLSDIVRMVKEKIHYNETEKGCIGIVDSLRQIARDSNLWISGGGIHEAGAPPLKDTDNNATSSRVYNTHIIINEQGEVVCRYRKIHLFEVSIPSQQLTLRESDTTAPGDSIVVCHDSPIGSLGLSTCYDVRFPEQYTELAKHGAQVLLVPSAFTVPTGQVHWHTLLRARAIENQCYVIAAAQYGVHNKKRTSYGHSIAIDPWGVVLADAGGFDGPGTTQLSTNNEAQAPPIIITCDIDLNHLSSIRERMPIQKHREQAKLL
jgi:predicted amidohydrolase